METLEQYVYKRLDRYDDDKKCTIKVVLKYLKADHILVDDYCNLFLNKTIEESNSKEIIRHMVLNSPFGYSYREQHKDNEVPVKKRVLSFNEEFEKDELFNC